MATEASFKASVHRLLDKRVYVEGMSNPYRGGTLDTYYEGSKGVLWVEWKYKPVDIPNTWKQPTELQKRWYSRAYKNRVEVALIMGCKRGGYIGTGYEPWNRKLPLRLPKQAIADWIQEKVL